MALEIKNIGVIGSNGFIGKYLLQRFNSKGIKFIPFTGNLLNEKDIEKFFIENKIELVINLVSIFKGSFDDLLNVNVLGIQKLLSVGKNYGLKKIIYTSSGAVYGDSKTKYSNEIDEKKPNTEYGLSKSMAEDVILFFRDNYNIESIILRFPNIYDSKGLSKGIISTFKKGIEENKEVTIYGDGSESRDFLFVDDAINSILLSISYNGSLICNISSKCRLSVNDVINILKKKFSFNVNYNKGSENNLKYMHLDYSLAVKKLGYIPQNNSLII